MTHERVIALDTETTGMSHKNGDRVIEIGAVELIGNIETGKTFHTYLDPYPRPVHPDAVDVHGLTTEFLTGKPKFREVVSEFLDFIGDAPLVIHNSTFDMGFLDMEFTKIGKKPIPNEVRDTLKIARLKYPGQRHTLDALCSFLGVDNSGRDLHGALIDASLLAQVYVRMQGLDRLALDRVSLADEEGPQETVQRIARKVRERRGPLLPTQEELDAFEAFISADVKNSLWLSA